MIPFYEEYNNIIFKEPASTIRLFVNHINTL